MVNKGLPSMEMELLREVISKQQPTLVPLLDVIGVTPLTLDQREALRRAIDDELIETGFGEKHEPNTRGYILEDLIDKLGHV